MVAVTLHNITHIYDRRVKALDNLNVEFKDRKLSAVLGPSGCGKTTLLKIIAGLLRPTEGRVYFDSRDVTDLHPRDRNVSMVFQFPVVYVTMTVHDNLAIPLQARGFSKGEIHRMVKEVAQFLDVEQYLNVRAGRLPLHIKQKVALGRAIIRDFDILILDEPLTYIDPAARLELRERIVRIKLEREKTMLYVTHDQAEALTLGDMIAIMKDGKLLQYSSPEDVYYNPKNTFVAWFIGNPGMNLINCEYVRKGEKNFIKFKDVEIAISDQLAKLISDRSETNEIILGIRPEHVRLSLRRSPDSFPARVELVEELGYLTISVLKHEDIEFRVKSPTRVKEGEEVYVEFPKENLRIFTRDGFLIA